jgi:hypothetical protein
LDWAGLAVEGFVFIGDTVLQRSKCLSSKYWKQYQAANIPAVEF